MTKEQEIMSRCWAVFRDACAAFERGDMVEHKRLRLIHKKLAEQHEALIERSQGMVH